MAHRAAVELMMIAPACQEISMERFDRLDAVAVLWWSRDDYPEMLEAMADAHKLPQSFDEWETLAKEAIDTIRRQGATPVKVTTSLDQLADYCRRMGLKLDGRGRARFAADPGNWPMRSKH